MIIYYIRTFLFILFTHYINLSAKDQQTEMVTDSHANTLKKLPVTDSNSIIVSSSQTNATQHAHAETSKQPSGASSVEIENLVKVNCKKVYNANPY